MRKKVLFLLPYPLHQAPSQRFRVEAYFQLLHNNNIPFDAQTFLDNSAWKILYQGGATYKKAVAVIKGLLKRFHILSIAGRYDYIFIHREAAPLGPPVFEWMLAKVLRKKIIFDFDDAIWIPNVTESNRLAASVKGFWKVKYITRWSYKISAGNAFLANWSLQYNSQVVVNPTCVDMEHRFNRMKSSVGKKKVVIGWTGSHSTLKYLDLVFPVLQQLEQEFTFDFLVICNQPPSCNLQSLKFLKWQESTEIDDLFQIDIGLMPLMADAWSEGKCGFKLIQYLSLGIPAVASPVGVNKEIIEEGSNGFLCASEEEWYAALKTLLKNSTLRTELGKNGRQKMASKYSVQANAATFLSLFSE